MKYTFYVIIEYGLGDYVQIPYEWDITTDEKNVIDTCVSGKVDFMDSDELSDLYSRIFEEAYKIESEKYYDENESFENPDDEVIPFDNFSFYITLGKIWSNSRNFL